VSWFGLELEFGRVNQNHHHYQGHHVLLFGLEFGRVNRNHLHYQGHRVFERVNQNRLNYQGHRVFGRVNQNHLHYQGHRGLVLGFEREHQDRGYRHHHHHPRVSQQIAHC